MRAAELASRSRPAPVSTVLGDPESIVDTHFNESKRRHCHRHTVKCVHSVVEASLRGADEANRSDLCEERRQYHLGFLSRHHLSKTLVYSIPKSDVTRVLTGWVKPIGLRPIAGIPIGGREEQQHLGTLGNNVLRHGDLASGGPEEGLNRTIPA